MDGFQFQYRIFCDFCGGNHPNYECQSGNFLYHSSFYEPPNLVSDFNRGYYSYINNYDPGGWNNANYMWNQGNVQPSYEFDDRKYNSNLEEMLAKCIQSAERQCQNFQRSFQNQDHEDSRLEEMWTKFIISNEERMQNQEASMKKLEVQLNQLISIVSEQLKDAEINLNKEVVDTELYSIEVENLNAHVKDEEVSQTQNKHDEQGERLKENTEGDCGKDFLLSFLKDEVNDIEIKLVNGSCYVLNCESSEWFDDKEMRWKFESANMKADFDPGPKFRFDSFCQNIFLKIKFRNYEHCDLSADLPCGILKLKIKINGRRYKYYKKRMKEI